MFTRILIVEKLPQWIMSSNEGAYHPFSNTIYLRRDVWKKHLLHELLHWFFCLVRLNKGHQWIDKLENPLI